MMYFVIVGKMSCSICLDAMAAGEILVLNCGHSFHRECVRKLVVEYGRIKCPYCRQAIAARIVWGFLVEDENIPSMEQLMPRR